MAIHSRTSEELHEAYRNQRKALRASCAACDDGERWEALRIATAVYTLVKEGPGKTTSMLKQLGVKDALGFVDSSRGMADSWPYLPLCVMNVAPMSYAPRFVLPFEEAHGRVPFDQWWDGEVFQLTPEVFSPGHSARRLSRRDLVIFMRNKDGGSHYDGELDNEVYIQLAVEKFTGIETNAEDGSWVPVPWALEATMRQIGWEVEATLDELDRALPQQPPAA